MTHAAAGRFAYGCIASGLQAVDPRRTMGALALYLATQFERFDEPGWTAAREQPLLAEAIARRYGFSPCVDVLLTGPDGRRVAVEFEVSRADPVANQVKFLVALQAGDLGRDDVVISMMSSHVTRGRRAITAAFGRHLRTLGVSAFPTSLLPDLGPDRVRALNHSEPDAIEGALGTVRDEVQRILSIVTPRGRAEHRIHFAGDVTDIVANLWAFNDGWDGSARSSWGRRSVQFFVVDPVSGLFAPSKFCAFVPTMMSGGSPPPGTMTHGVYASLGEGDSRFDGHVARKHLEQRLAFRPRFLEGSGFESAFSSWHAPLRDHVGLREPTQLLFPPDWYSP